MRSMSAVWRLAVVVAAAGCAATTAFTSTWRNPETKPVSLEGEKVVALVISTHEVTRRGAEGTLAAQITARGAEGVPAWTILPTADVRNEEAATAAMTNAGASAVVVMEVVFQSQELTPSNFRTRWSSPAHRHFWPHYRLAWQVAWSPPPALRTNVWIETLMYTFEPDQLIWGGRSRTVALNATTAELFTEVANAAATEIARAGLLKASSE